MNWIGHFFSFLKMSTFSLILVLRKTVNTNVHEKIDIFNNTILNILRNSIPHQFVVCDGKDWLTMIQQENKSINPGKKSCI